MLNVHKWTDVPSRLRQSYGVALQTILSRLSSAAPRSEMKSEEGVSRLANVHALIAEDDALIALDIEHTLASHFGLRLSVVHGLNEAVRLASGDRPDIAILDLVLRGESVEPLARLLAADGVPILFVSGYRSHPLEHLADGLMLEKPYSSEKLIEFVGLALGRLAR